MIRKKKKSEKKKTKQRNGSSGQKYFIVMKPLKKMADILNQTRLLQGQR